MIFENLVEKCKTHQKKYFSFLRFSKKYISENLVYDNERKYFHFQKEKGKIIRKQIQSSQKLYILLFYIYFKF